jgi:hypothetical protein
VGVKGGKTERTDSGAFTRAVCTIASISLGSIRVKPVRSCYEINWIMT